MRDPAFSEPLREARATCPYCGTGCGVILQARGEQVVGVRGDPDHPANSGRLCTKGQTLHLTVTPEVRATRRLLTPQMRDVKGGARRLLDWPQALEAAADRFAAAIARDPARVAFYVSGQLLTEDYYVFNKLARALARSNNIDSNSRLCMSSAVVGYKRTLGSDAPPCSYEDLELADCVFVAGANPAVAHPVLFGRLLEARRARGSTLIVVDPRRTETAEAADLHLALAPGTDLYLFVAMLGVMLRDGLVDADFVAAHTSGFEACAAQARALPLADAARLTGLAPQDIERAARLFARAPATLSLYCQGLNQSAHGSDSNCALIHLHLASGQVARAGAGPFSLTGQPNAMGGRETGTMASLLPGHRDPASAADRAELAALWGVDALPAAPGLTAVELFDACARGDIDALWIACTNPAQSLPDQARVQAALARVPFVVVQEAFADAETVAHADLLLPAASFGERSGTMTNSERRIALSEPLLAPPGQARPDWQIAADFARRLAARIAPDKAGLFDWPDAAAVYAEHAALTAGRDLDIAGLSHALLARRPLQWPLQWLPSRQQGSPDGTPRLYGDRRFATADGRAQFAPIELRGPAEMPGASFPLSLTTVRLRDVWHGGSRSGTVPALDLPPPALAIGPETLVRLGLVDDEIAELSTARGTLLLPLRADARLRAGLVSLPMHHGRQLWPSGEGINLLTLPVVDPLSKQPELKHAAARVTAVELCWHAVLLARVPAAAVSQVQQAMRALAARCAFGSVTPFGRDPQRPALLLQLAAREPQGGALGALAASLGLSPQSPRLADARAGRVRALQLDAGRLTLVLLEGRRRADVGAWPIYQRLMAEAADCSRRSLRELFAPV